MKKNDGCGGERRYEKILEAKIEEKTALNLIKERRVGVSWSCVETLFDFYFVWIDYLLHNILQDLMHTVINLGTG